MSGSHRRPPTAAHRGRSIDVTDMDTPKPARPPATRRESDNTAVPWPVAKQAWADAAVPALRTAGATYNTIVRYKELGEAVQAATGIRTRSLLQNWIGEVLRAVTDAPHEADEPMLCSLVVDATGQIGPGYADAVASREGEAPTDPDMHAAIERLRCYRSLGATIPEKARPQLPPDFALRRQAEAKARQDAAPLPKCPTCGNWKGLAAAFCDDCTP